MYHISLPTFNNMLICVINIYIRYKYSQKDVFTTSIAYISSIKNINSGTSRERFFNSGTFNNTQEHVPQEHVFFVPELRIISKKIFYRPSAGPRKPLRGPRKYDFVHNRTRDFF